MYKNIDQVLKKTNTDLKIFGKPQVLGKRRMGVVLARDKEIEKAKQTVSRMVDDLEFELR
ncbi:MAG: hypothetical protein N4Q30_01245 [Neisseriaceae bacterium]|nr:hypothetical protein [Neisseriaceae bacterium]